MITAIGLSFRAAREGSYRRGEGWYLDAKQPEEGPLPAYQRPGRRMGAPRSAIVGRSLGGIGLILAGVGFWTVIDLPMVGILVGVFGLAVVGYAIQGLRENRWLRIGRDRIEHPHHHLPPSR